MNQLTEPEREEICIELFKIWALEMREAVAEAAKDPDVTHLDQWPDMAYIDAKRCQQRNPGQPCTRCQAAEMGICNTCTLLGAVYVERWVEQVIELLGANQNGDTATSTEGCGSANVHCQPPGSQPRSRPYGIVG